MRVIEGLRTAFREMEPNGIAVKVSAVIPVVSNIVLVLKKSQYLSEPQRDEGGAQEWKKLVRTMSAYGQLQRIMMVALVAISCAYLPLFALVAIVGFSLCQLHQWSVYESEDVLPDCVQVCCRRAGKGNV